MHIEEFKIRSDVFGLTRTRLIRAMHVFDDEYRGREPSFGTGYGVNYNDKVYPPKRVLGLAIKRQTSEFSGGERTNRVFEKLGFPLIEITSKTLATRSKWMKTTPTAAELVKTLFSQTWSPLHPSEGAAHISDYPGIYVLAYTRNHLTDQRIREEDVFYVGMSNHAGLARRVGQFKKGLEDGHHHYGAKRFFHQYASDVPYSRLRHKKKFYFAGVSVPCVTAKDRRLKLELQKMGVVADAEYCVIARIRDVTGHEPELNAK